MKTPPIPTGLLWSTPASRAPHDHWQNTSHALLLCLRRGHVHWSKVIAYKLRDHRWLSFGIRRP